MVAPIFFRTHKISIYQKYRMWTWTDSLSEANMKALKIVFLYQQQSLCPDTSFCTEKLWKISIASTLAKFRLLKSHISFGSTRTLNVDLREMSSYWVWREIILTVTIVHGRIVWTFSLRIFNLITNKYSLHIYSKHSLFFLTNAFPVWKQNKVWRNVWSSYENTICIPLNLSPHAAPRLQWSLTILGNDRKAF